MKLLSRQNNANGVYVAWMKQYPKDKDNIGVRLKKLGKHPDPLKVNRIMGNCSWTEVGKCSECKRKVRSLVVLGEHEDYDSATAYICHTCLKKALKLK